MEKTVDKEGVMMPVAPPGLENVVVSETAMSDVQGRRGRLILRGYDARELAGRTSFEEVAFLMWHGRLPKRAELNRLEADLKARRRLPDSIRAVLRAVARSLAPMDALRAAVAAREPDDYSAADGGLAAAKRLTALVPTFIAAGYRIRQGQEPIEARDDLGHAANYLYMINGKESHPACVRGLNTYLGLVADHSMNASTFTARVVTSTESDMVSSVAAAIGTLKGPLHGGAPGPVLQMLLAIGRPENADAWLRNELKQGRRIMGIGHRVYKTRDARAAILQQAAEEVAEETGKRDLVELAKHAEQRAVAILQEEKPGRDLYANVEWYTAVLLNEVGLPEELFSPTFAAGRVAGWTGHVMEQRAHNRIFRPESLYIGPTDLQWKPVDERA